MSEDQDESSKTEDPTQKRLEEAFKKGQVVNSKEVTSFMMLFAFAVVIYWAVPNISTQMVELLTPFITRPETIQMDAAGTGQVLYESTISLIKLLTLPFMLFFAAALAANLLQNPFHISGESIVPKLEKISLMKGAKRLFSKRSLVEFLKGLIKISVVATVGFLAVWPFMPRLKQAANNDVLQTSQFIWMLAGKMMIGVLMVAFVIAAIDYLYQRFDFMKNMRMTKQELKEEYKQQEGDPHIKQRLRQLRMERARKRMMAAVPTSDVVITNPTHFAIALTYDPQKMGAPILVAKGADLVAHRIREMAKEHDVPIVENAPLARVLYAEVDLDEEIPIAHFKAVAEVIGFVYRLKGKKKTV